MTAAGAASTLRTPRQRHPDRAEAGSDQPCAIPPRKRKRGRLTVTRQHPELGRARLLDDEIVIGALFGWTAGHPLEVVEKYKETLKKYPNPPAANLTRF